MIRNVKYHRWVEVPLQIVVQELSRLRAGVIYYPQDFDDNIASVAFQDLPDRDALVSAIEGLELALVIANRLSLDYSVYNNEQTTIRSIRESAWRRWQQTKREIE